VQACPFGRFATQAPLWHSPPKQSASAVQVDDLHAVPDAQITPPEQAVAAGVEQVPVPLQSPVGVSWLPLQETAPQLMLVVAYRQPPLPSQVPSCPQAAVSAAQAPAEEPPDATGLQSPVAQVMQVPVQAAAQQIPEMQLACVHWLFLLQVDPSDVVAAQVIVDVQ
jgi:hypothetical protein